jgi:L-fuculose-phosphate aldolase
MDRSVTYLPIGHVVNEFDDPAKPSVIHNAKSEIHIDAQFAEALDGLSVGDRILVIYHFHRVEGYELKQHPRGDRGRPPRGLFSLRTPHRPNPIGVDEADILAMDECALTVRGLEAINGTPVLDIKPAPALP